MSVSAKDNLKDFVIGLLNEPKTQNLLSKAIISIDLTIEDVGAANEISQHAAGYGIEAVEDAVHSQYPNLEVNLTNIGLPTQLHLINATMIGKLVAVKGIVNSMDNTVKPMFFVAKFKCKKCNNLQTIDQTDPFKLQLPFLSCDHQTFNQQTQKSHKCGGIKFDLDLMASVYIDSRKISIQSVPEDNTIQIPEMKDVLIIKKSLLYKVRCGDRVTIIGVVKVRPDKGERIASFYIEANNIIVNRKELTAENLSSEDIEKIKAFSAESDFFKKLIKNIAPSIHGMDNEKEACAYALVGGVPKTLPDINWREIIHVLYVGDPSTAKTQLLTATMKIAPSGIFSSGRGSTAAGLTAAVLKEPNSNSWIISAGVLVLADRGIACIDEIEKMNPDDRSALHDALERNIVSINKANIHVDLPSKTSVIAAANPKLGQYDLSKTVVENIQNLSVPLLTRFDIIFIVKDTPNKARDTSIFRHLRDAQKVKEGVLDRTFLKKFIIYAKSLSPEMTDDAHDFLEKYYVEARSQNNTSRLPITPRHADALIRISEAHSKLCLKDKVDREDAQAAIRILESSMTEIGDVQTMAETKGEKVELLIKILKDKGPLEENQLKELACSQMSDNEFFKNLISLKNCGRLVEIESSPPTYGLPSQKRNISSYG